jgi:S1-C subfamily serine protease
VNPYDDHASDSTPREPAPAGAPDGPEAVAAPTPAPDAPAPDAPAPDAPAAETPAPDAPAAETPAPDAPAASASATEPEAPPEPMPWWSRPVSEPMPTAGSAHRDGPAVPLAAAASDQISSDPWIPLTDTPGGGGAPRKGALLKRLRQGTAATVAAVVVSAAAAGTVVHLVDDHSGGVKSAAASSTSVANLPSAAQLSSTVKSALAKIQPSVVLINDTVTAGSNGRGGFGGFGGFEESGAGTGIVISADGEVVTNAHVVNGATNIKVTLPNNGGSHDASIVGIDTSKDLAVIKISGVSNLTPATFANSDTVQVGDSVIAVGNALGYGGSPTVTEGIVSAKDRSLRDSTDNLSGLLQTDAAINPGNSGGPLVDANGDVIGINVAVATGSSTEPAQNIGFSIPSNTVVADLPSLKAGKNSSGNTSQSSTFLGVEVTDANNGAGIVAVQPGSPADDAGLRPGDVVTKFNDTTISNGSDLQRAVRAEKPNTTVTLTIVRGGNTTTVKVKLGSTALSS